MPVENILSVAGLPIIKEGVHRGGDPRRPSAPCQAYLHFDPGDQSFPNCLPPPFVLKANNVIKSATIKSLSVRHILHDWVFRLSETAR